VARLLPESERCRREQEDPSRGDPRPAPYYSPPTAREASHLARNRHHHIFTTLLTVSSFHKVTAIDTGAGAVVFDKPITIGFVVKDRLVSRALFADLVRGSEIM
jgi:hypothetical protein